jgi:hypothetical protein
MSIAEEAYQESLCENAEPFGWEDQPKNIKVLRITQEQKRTLILAIELIESNIYYNDHIMFDLCNLLKIMLKEMGQK